VPAATLLVFVGMIVLSSRSLSDRSSGSISLSDVALLQEAGQWYLNASVDIKLPEPIRDGLDSGVPLDFILTLSFRSPRRFWFDALLAQHRSRFRLTYYELTRHYRVYGVDNDVSRNFRSLSAALAGLGQFNRLPLPDIALPALTESLVAELPARTSDEPPSGATAGTRVLAELNFRLDSQSLPLPLQPLIASSWRLASEEYRWQVN
jgi:hypothetical protein